MSQGLHVLWVNTVASCKGGCERYIADAAALMRERGVKCSLLYDVDQPADTAFLQGFDGAFPRVDVARQLRQIDPDLIYVHRVADERTVSEFVGTRAPVIRFFHDHKLFCLREHKYTTLKRRTCVRTTGLNCYSCLGFIGRSDSGKGFSLQGLGSLERDQQANRGLDGFVVGSRYMADHLGRHGFDRRKTHVIPLFARAAPPHSPAAREQDLLLFVGQLIRGKGLDLLLEALPHTRRTLRLTVVGEGKQEHVYRRQAGALGIEHRVDFVGKLLPSEVADLYRRARCLVVPSRTPETFSLVGVEAMSAGTPVVAADVGAIGEWLEDGVTGLTFPSGDVPALVRAIDRMVDWPGGAELMGWAAARMVHEHFRPDRHIDALLALFTSLANTQVAA